MATSRSTALDDISVQTAQVQRTLVFSTAPPGLGSDFLVDEELVVGMMYTGQVPGLWWIVGNSADPLVFLVGEDTSGTAPGYHLAAPSLSWMVPFPAVLFTLPFIPYAYASIPTAGIATTASQLAQRDSTGCGGHCDPIGSLDNGTATMSHELVEAVTDPFPFSGWANLNLFPAWYDGEIGDICDLTCKNSVNHGVRETRVGNTVLTTYWSNADGKCVGPWRPSIRIAEPRDGMLVGWKGSGTAIGALAQVTTAIDRGDLQSSSVAWAVDNLFAGKGRSTTAINESFADVVIGSPGVHTITATVTDANGQQASAHVSINAVTDGPVVVIDAPDDGTTIVAGGAVTWTGPGTDRDHPSGLPDSQLEWSQSDGNGGYGSMLTEVYPRVGDFTMTLWDIDSVGLKGSVSRTVHVVRPSGSPAVVITSPGEPGRPLYYLDTGFDAQYCKPHFALCSCDPLFDARCR